RSTRDWSSDVGSSDLSPRGLRYAKKAAERVADDEPSGLALSAYLGYVQALEANKKPDDAKPYVAKIEKAAEEVIKEVKDDKERRWEERRGGTGQEANG